MSQPRGLQQETTVKILSKTRVIKISVEESGFPDFTDLLNYYRSILGDVTAKFNHLEPSILEITENPNSKVLYVVLPLKPFDDLLDDGVFAYWGEMTKSHLCTVPPIVVRGGIEDTVLLDFLDKTLQENEEFSSLRVDRTTEVSVIENPEYRYSGIFAIYHVNVMDQ